MKFIDIKQKRIEKFEEPFRKLVISDKEWAQAILRADGGTGAHINFEGMLLSQEMYSYETALEFYNCIVKKPWMENNKIHCQYPIGTAENRKKAVKEIIKIYKHKSKEFVFYALADDTLEELKGLYGKRITNVLNDRDSQEYILDVAEFLKQEGPEYANMRTKMRRFNRNNAWTYEEISKESLQECIELSEKWYQEHADDQTAVAEHRATKFMFEHYFESDYKGGLFRIDGKVISFCVGAPLNNEIFVDLIRKTDNSYRDATMSFVYEFVKNACSEYKYVNDSCDMGLPGLRRFKELLKPKYMNNSYSVTVKIR